MKALKALAVPLLVMGLVLCGFSAYAGETGSGQTAKSGWEFEVIPYLWMAGVGGDVKAKGEDAHMSASFGDIWDNLEFGAQAHVEARNGKWGMFLDATYLDVSNTKEEIRREDFGPVDGKVDITEWIVELGGAYQVAKWRVQKESAVSLDILGGGRYWYMEGKLTLSHPDLDSSGSQSVSDDWIDPFVGARLGVELGRYFTLGLRGDIGGFGVGSEFSWNAMITLRYRITRLISAWVGYRALGVDYKTGSGDDKVEYDLVMHGPMIGLGFSF